MANIAVLGAQWGDEGKGKIVDLYSESCDIIVRYQGGNNAGHTLVVDGEKTILHLIPSGVLHPNKTCVIASGVVLDPEIFLKEVEKLTEKKVIGENSKSNTKILVSKKAHIIMPYHKVLDSLRENKSAQKIGTTGRGIGPCYEDKIGRRGIMAQDLLEPQNLKFKIQNALREKNILFQHLYDYTPLDENEIFDWALNFGEKLKPFLTDTQSFLLNSIKEKKKILFEGAQGALLDIDHGTYPFVTSSNTVSGGIFTGTGTGPQVVDKIIGITKAYTTRVGEGPFPTELFDETGELLRKIGNEYGATTGRPRRCGWLDLVALKHAVQCSGITALALTKLDVLTNFPNIQVCIGYEIDGKIITDFPSSVSLLKKVKPIYKKFASWNNFPKDPKSKSELPNEFLEYLQFIENFLNVPILTISFGPNRHQTINEMIL
jgi:adenylosuccinate synthase